MENREYLFIFIIYMYINKCEDQSTTWHTYVHTLCVDVRMSCCTLILTFLCLLCGLPLSIPPLNRIFRFSDPVSVKEINYLPLRNRLFLNMQLGLKNLLLDSTLCSNSLELLVFFKSQNVMANGYYGIETLYQM